MSNRWIATACLALSLAASCCSTPATEPPRGEAVVYVIERGWHTDIGLPVEEISGPLKLLRARSPGASSLVFGFGERQFLVHRRSGLGSMLRALLPSQSTLLMTALRATPQDAFGSANVISLRLSHAGMQAIEASIWRQFELSPGKQPVWLAEGPYPGSAYYAAGDAYDAINTCNTWTARTLRDGGLPMPVAGVAFAGQVMGMARWMGEHQSAARLNPVRQ